MKPIRNGKRFLKEDKENVRPMSTEVCYKQNHNYLPDIRSKQTISSLSNYSNLKMNELKQVIPLHQSINLPVFPMSNKGKSHDSIKDSAAASHMHYIKRYIVQPQSSYIQSCKPQVSFRSIGQTDFDKNSVGGKNTTLSSEYQNQHIPEKVNHYETMGIKNPQNGSQL